MKYEIWYMKPSFFRYGIHGIEFLRTRGEHVMPNPKNLTKTHVHLKQVEVPAGLEDAFMQMQGEIWSPNGEARDLIKSKGLEHTSMSVGDIAVDESGNVFIVDLVGWYELKDETAPAG